MYKSGLCPLGKAFVDVAVAGARGESRFLALIDTGATISGIGGKMAEKMGLQWVGTRKGLRSASGDMKDADSYRAVIRLLAGEGVASAPYNAEVIDLPFHGRKYDMLLGMNVLSRCCFVCRGDKFFLGFDGGDDKTLQAAADFILRQKCGAGKQSGANNNA